MQIQIDRKDMKQFNKMVKKAIKNSPQETDQLLKETALHIKSQSKQLQIPKTGFLRKKITTGTSKEGYEVSSTADYSIFEEFGTRYRPAKPFFRPAIEKGMTFLEKEIKQRFNY